MPAGVVFDGELIVWHGERTSLVVLQRRITAGRAVLRWRGSIRRTWSCSTCYATPRETSCLTFRWPNGVAGWSTCWPARRRG
ncbi:MAG TPA: hypothetical protein VFT95_23835 [Micromonosporaceae bacterium]|nr:hypothetical protein [Micromonosporaceae bacterium]